MAGDWIKMRTNLRRSPKVVRIASALKADRLRVIGGLHAVWCLFDEHSIDGHLDGYTLETLDEEIGWPGFGAAMVAAEWLEDGGDFLSTPRFDEHNGQSAKRRCQEAERKRNERKSSASTSASNADKKRTREEKRREEKEEPLKPIGASAPTGTVVELRQGVLDAIEEALPAEVDAAQQIALDAAAKEKPAREEYPAEFEAVWAMYPARFGGNPKKETFKHWSARRREGVTAQEMMDGLARYAAHCAAAGKVGTEYVMHGSTFFGTSKRYAEQWPTTRPNATVPNKANGRPSINSSFTPGADDDIFNELRRELR